MATFVQLSMEEIISLASEWQNVTKQQFQLTLTLLQTSTLTLTLILTLTQPYSKLVSKPILKKKILTKCQSEVSEIVDAAKHSLSKVRWLWNVLE